MRTQKRQSSLMCPSDHGRSCEAKYARERAEGLPSQRAGIRGREPEANVSFIPRDIT